MIAPIEQTAGPEKSDLNKTQLATIAKAWKAPTPIQGRSIIKFYEAAMAADDDDVENFDDPPLIHYPGLETAVIGEVDRGEYGLPVLCYSRARIVAILMVRDGMTREDAEEYIDFNIAGGSLGPRTPVLLS